MNKLALVAILAAAGCGGTSPCVPSTRQADTPTVRDEKSTGATPGEGADGCADPGPTTRQNAPPTVRD